MTPSWFGLVEFVS